MKNFRTFSAAVEFYRCAQGLPLKGHLKDQFDRASLSIVLNLAEGRGRRTAKDQKKFFSISFGSLREVQGLLILLGLEDSKEWRLLDSVAAQLYRLIEKAGG